MGGILMEKLTKILAIFLILIVIIGLAIWIIYSSYIGYPSLCYYVFDEELSNKTHHNLIEELYISMDLTKENKEVIMITKEKDNQ